jgi:hypothetical protein
MEYPVKFFVVRMSEGQYRDVQGPMSEFMAHVVAEYFWNPMADRTAWVYSPEECLKSEISQLRTDAALAYAEAATVA